MTLARIFFIKLSVIMMLFMTSCSNDGEFNQSAEGVPVVIVSKTVTDYSAVEVRVQFRGTVIPSVSDLDRLQFYSEDTCTGTKLGEALVSQFKANGAPVILPTGTGGIEIYVSTEASTDCIFLEKYFPGVMAPGLPVFSHTIPESPTRTITSPGVFGSAFPSSGVVKFYDDVLCANLLTQGSAVDFASTGILVTVPENVTTTLYAVVEDSLGAKSACEYLADYAHSNQLSGPPQLTSVSHTSPNKDSFTPTIKGSTAVGTLSVSLYSDPGCLSALASGLPDDFLTAGFEVTAIQNDTMPIYAKSIDDLNQPSVCALLTSYTHDDVAPAAPVYSGVSPVSPTNQTTLPKVQGVSSVDTDRLSFYDSGSCLILIGTGTKSDFETLGIGASVGFNDTTSIFAKSFDAAGNDSPCVSFTSYVHNTFPPSPPVFVETTPSSPSNGTISPLVKGVSAERTVLINLYSDETCLALVGSGTVAEYQGSGITANLTANTTNSVYVTVLDVEGNVSTCTYHATYDHSNVAAPSPGFFATFPVSPSRSSYTPTVIGLADSSIETVTLYDSATCLGVLGSGTRGQYVSSGITVTLPQNSTTDIYSIATDKFGNDSLCVSITQYIHNTVAPLAPTYTLTAPISPNNVSTSPVLTGTALDNPASQLPALRIDFFDSGSCISKLGEGTPAEFSGAGVTVNVASNVENFIYGKSFDAAGNGSACTLMTTYIYNNLIPGAPTFLSTLPASPSYTEDLKITGTFAASPDFMNKVSVIFYSNPGCSTELVTGNPIDFIGAGVDLTAGNNTTTAIYGVSVNEVGTRSSCNLLTSFQHYDLAPVSLTIFNNVDGSVALNWIPDTTSSPVPTYSIERSLYAAGPFSVIASGIPTNSLKDIFISDTTEYFYRVFATNNTGRSLYSTEEAVTTMAPPAVTVASLTAQESDSKITLSWGGFIQNMTYKISRSTSPGGPFVDLGVSLEGTTYVDLGLTNNQKYYYIVIASNPSGGTVQSNVASAVPKVVPLAPTEFSLQPMASAEACAGARGAAVAWTAPSYYTTFDLYRGEAKFNTDTVLTTSSLSDDRCSIPSNVLYYYRVGAVWGSNVSSSSNVVGFHTRSAPNFTVYPGNGEVKLSWSSSTLHENLTGLTLLYNIFYSSDYKGDYTLLAGGLSGLTYTDVLSNGVGRFYYLQAYVIDGDGDKVYIGYPTSIRGVSPDVDPSPVTNLVLSVVNDTVRLDWSAPDHYNQFKIYYSSSLGGSYSEVLEVSNSIAIGIPLIEGMNYFKVRASWGAFETADSNIVSHRDATITGLLLSSSAIDLSLSWNIIPGIQDYEVLRSADKNGPYVSLATPVSNAYTDATAVSGEGYYYKVRARFADTTKGLLSDAVKGMRTDLSIPSGISLSVQAASFIRVDWPKVSGATIYQVRLAASLGGPYVSKGTTFGTNFSLTGLSANTEYFVKVRSTVAGSNFLSAAASAWTYVAPSPPTVSPENNSIDVTWGVVVGAVDYDVLRSTDAVTFTTLVSGYGSTSYLDTGALNGTMYFYKIQANYATDQLQSEQSLGVTPGTTPLVPAQLRAENNGVGTEVEVSWSAVSGITQYNVYLSTTSGVYGAPARSSTTNLNVRVTGLTTGTVYYLTVTALNGGLESLKSNEVVIIPELEAIAPFAQYSDASTVDITWTAAPGAATYDLLRSIDGVNFDILTTGLGTTTHLDGSLDPLKTYYYRYRGYTAAGVEMSLSQVSNGVNISETSEVPLGFRLGASATSSVDITWISVPNIYGYEILRSLVIGGPYTPVVEVLANVSTYTDTTVVAGLKYFYVIRSLSQSRTPSAYSVERSIELVAGPTSLVATNGVSTVELNWDVVGSAISYNVYRSLETSGPYGLIGNIATNSYSDSEIIADEMYYYVVDAVFADGSTSVRSLEESILRTGYISLQVTIELLDGAMSSSSASTLIFDRTTTSFDTNDYDGVSSYELEVIAVNTDSSARLVAVVDEVGAVIGSVSVPALTTDPTRIRAVFTPNVGDDFYRAQLDQTTSDGELIVYAVRFLVNQVNATKTKLYFPLLSSDQSPTSGDLGAYLYSTADELYQDFPNATAYQRMASKLKTIIDYNAWELEVVASTTGLAEGIFGLQNMDTSAIIEMTETRIVSNTMQVASVPFDEGAADFDGSNEGDRYALRVKCEYECASGEVRLYRAGLWVKLENLTQARVVQRLTSYNFISSTADVTNRRSYLDLSKFSSSKVYFQALTEDDPGASGDLDLIYSVQDSGSAGISVVPGSNLLVDSDGLNFVLSPELTVSTGNNFMTRVTPAAGDIVIRDASIIVEVGN